MYGYVDTPAKRAVREMREWAPIFRNQDTPPFAQMAHVAFNYDNTKFEDTQRLYPMPEAAPTGGGLHHPQEDRETSHFMGKMLDQINPDLATVYRGGASNEHLLHAVLHTDTMYSARPPTRDVLDRGAYSGRPMEFSER